MSLLSSLGLGTNKQVQNVAPVAGGSTYLQDMQKLLAGDLSSSLTGGEKLTTLGALLKSAARGSQTSPQDVIAQARQMAQNRTSTQLQLAQLQAKAAEEARLKADQQAFVATLPNKLQDTAKALRGESLDSFIKNLRMNASYKRVIEDGKPVTKVVYGSGLEENASFLIPPDSEKVFIGGKPVWVDKDTRQPLIDPNTGQPLSAGDPMTPKEMADLAVKQSREARMASRPTDGGGGSGGGGSTQYIYKNLMTTGGRMATYAIPKNNPNGPKTFVGFVKDQPLIIGNGILPPAPK